MDIILENGQFRLTLGSDCRTKSLLHKASGQECLDTDHPVSFFSVTQDRPFNNELKLAYCNKRTTFQGNSLRWEDGKLIVGFELVHYSAVVEVKCTDSYITFRLVDFSVPKRAFGGLHMDKPPVAEFRLACLNVKTRENFGAWLDVMWDSDVAVNLLATSPYERIDSEIRENGRNLVADAVRGIRVRGCEAALIVTKPDTLLDCIEVLERDYGMPNGARARRSEYINASLYWVGGKALRPETVDTHISLCQKAGMKLMLIYYTGMTEETECYGRCGEYQIKECFGDINGLKAMVDKIRSAGILPGFHFLHTHIGRETAYVTPVADRRLNHIMKLTLSRDIGPEDTVIQVDQPPLLAQMHPDRRVLQFDGELIQYQRFTEEYPYRYEGCQRGYWNTRVTAHHKGTTGGVLDVSEYGAGSVYLDQNTDLQDEIAEKIAQIYDLGFEFIYFDGSEGVNSPYEYHIPNAQYRVYRKLGKEPVFCEGAAKAHFGWHMLSGANAFDLQDKAIVPVEAKLKYGVVKYPLRQAPDTAKDFTRLNFGWWWYFEDEQPDAYEYGTSHAAGWDCPVTVKGAWKRMLANPRNDDVLETLRRWEEARRQKLLTPEQKAAVRDPDREFHLLRMPDGSLALVEYFEVKTQGQLKAYVFEKDGCSHAVLWHRTGAASCRIPLSAESIHYTAEFGAEKLPVTQTPEGVEITVENRRYLRTDLPMATLRQALKAATLQEF